MYRKFGVTGVVFAAAISVTSAAFAGASDYTFEPVKAEVKKGNGVTLAVRLVHKPTGKPVSDAVIFSPRIDMSPEGMETMTAVPTANSKRLTASANRLILAADERSLQVDLVRLDRTVPAAGCVASREPCPSTSTQRAAAQIPKAVGVR
jgi:hypothetical protein